MKKLKPVTHKGKAPSPQELQALVALFSAARYAEAATLAQTMTVRFPMHWVAWKMLGVVWKQMGWAAEALVPMQKAAALSPGDAENHNNLGIILKDLGRLPEAEASYRRALQIQPDYARAYNNLGITLKELGRLPEAEASYRQALEISPDYAEAHSNLGNALHDLGRLPEAEASYRRALQISPDYADAHFNLGNVLNDLSRQDEAEACYRRALQIAPDYAEAHTNLGAILHSLDRLKEAEACYRRALQIRPDDPEMSKNLGAVLENLGHYHEAKDCYRRAHQMGSHGARVQEALMLPAIMSSRAEMVECRSEFERNLEALLADEVTLEDPLKDVGETNFYLAFHGENNRALQVGCAALYARLFPSLNYVAAHCQQREPAAGRIRVGLLSKYFFNHSIGRSSRGLFAQLSRTEFEVTAIFVAPSIDDDYARFIREQAEHTLVVPQNLAAARRMIEDLHLDILFYQDIGMEPFSYFLAFSRLAPVQCVSFGHPDTTGIPTMDYFVSNDLYELPAAAAHYSERLFLLHDLPSLAYYYRPELPQPLKCRADFGLPDEDHLYICPQNLFKFHPDMDQLIAGILSRDARGRLVVIEGQVGRWTSLMRARWNALMPEVMDRVIFLPRQNSQDYLNLIALADVMLDTVHFNGMNTSLEALSVGTPIVTLPGEFQRGRHTQAMYRKMGLGDCIATDAEHYIELAVRLASDDRYRNRIRREIELRSGAIFEDLQVVREFERFFREATLLSHTAA